MKIKTTCLTMVIILSISVVFSQKNSYDTSVFWEIRRTPKSPPSYILGSYHQMDTSQMNFPIKTFTDLIDKCGSICLEVSGTDTSNISKLEELMWLPDEDKNIINRLDQEHYAKLFQILDSSKSLAGVKPLIDKLRPSVIASIIRSAKRSKIKVDTSEFFYPDLYFEQYARKKGYKVNPLETFDKQLEIVLMLNSTYDETLEVLKQTIDNYYAKDTFNLGEKYRNQDLKWLKPEANKDSSDNLDSNSRNIVMAEGIDSLLQRKRKSTFIIVGAAHLPYEPGVLNRLAKKGYIIKPHFIDFKKR
jgi:uncharacterized protein